MLPNGHTYRRDKKTNSWCRFSKLKKDNCGTSDSEVQASKSENENPAISLGGLKKFGDNYLKEEAASDGISEEEMMKKEKDRTPDILVSFSISGRDFDLDECSMRIGRKATRTWRQRHKHLQGRVDLANTSWAVETDWRPCESVDEAVSSLLEDVWPYRDTIIEYVTNHGLPTNLECSVRIWSDAPLYGLSVESMRKLVALNTEFSLGLYDYRGDEG
jgi:hypothetical protein